MDMMSVREAQQLRDWMPAAERQEHTDYMDTRKGM
jgi:hypothetical protein